MKSIKRMFTVLMSFCLVFSMFSPAVLAEEELEYTRIFYDDFSGATSDNFTTADYMSLPGDVTKPMYINSDDKKPIQVNGDSITINGTILTIGALSNASTSSSSTPGGVFDLSKPYKIIINLENLSGDFNKAFQVYIDNNTSSASSSIHGSSSRVYNTKANAMTLDPIEITSEVGTEASFISLRAESNLLVSIKSIEILTLGSGGEPEPPDPPDPPDPVVPAAPVITAQAGDQQVTLKWDAVAGASSYIVKRATTSGGPYDVVGESIMVMTYTDTGLTNEQPYYYVVSAVNIEDEAGEDSNEVEVIPTNTPIIPPTGPIFHDEFEGVPANFSDLFRPSYMHVPEDPSKAMYNDRNGTVSIDPLQETLTLSSGRLTIGKTMSGGTSSSDTVDDIFGVFDLSKDYVIIINALEVSGTGKIQVYVDNSTTSANSSAHGSSSRIYDKVANTITENKIIIPSDIGTKNSFIHIRAEGTSMIVIDSIAIIYAGDDDPTIPPIPPVPTQLEGIGLEGTVQLEWEPSHKAEGYYVKQYIDGAFVQIADVKTTSHTVTGLTNGVAYDFVVAAYNISGTSDDSEILSITPIETPIPAIPTGIELLPGSGEVTIAWDRVLYAEGYRVIMATESNGAYGEPQETLTNSYTFKGLENGRTYYFKVKAFNAKGASGYSDEVSATPDLSLSNKPLGFASIGNHGLGTTGGEGGEIITVTTGAELEAVMTNKRDTKNNKNLPPVIVRVEGTLSYPRDMLDVKEVYDVSIIGVGEDAKIDGFGLKVVRSNNIIIRNIEFTNATDDSIEIAESHNIWVDHNTFSNGHDGLLDIKQGSTGVTVSWNHFKEHRKNSLVGHSDNNKATDVNLQVTYHHNLFDATYSRNPRVRFGKVHIVNNYYRSVGTTIDGGGYGVGVAIESHVYVEGNYFEDVKFPILVAYPGSPIANVPGYVYHANNIYDGSGLPHDSETGPDFDPLDYYVFPVNDPAQIPDIVLSRAGSGKLDSSSPPSDPVTEAPPAPTGLQATGGDGIVELQWARANFASSYTVKRAESPEGTFAEIATDIKSTRYTDIHVENGKTYYYKVSAINEIGPSDDSNVSFATPEKVIVIIEDADTTGMERVINSDFNDGVTGVAPENYQIQEGGGKITITEVPSEVNKSVYLNDTSSSAHVNLSRSFAAQNKRVVVKVDFMQPVKGNATKILRLTSSDLTGIDAAVVLETNGGDISYRHAGKEFEPLVSSYNENQWYKITVDADVDKKQADIYIDGNLIVAGLPFHTIDELTMIDGIDSYTSDSGTAGHYLDNIQVYIAGSDDDPSDDPGTGDDDDPGTGNDDDPSDDPGTGDGGGQQPPTGDDTEPSSDQETEDDGDEDIPLVTEVDAEDLARSFAAIQDNEGPEQIVEIMITGTEGLSIVDIPVSGLLQGLQHTPDAILSIISEEATYNLPLSALDIEGLATMLDTDASELTMTITIERVSGELAEQVTQSAAAAGLTLLGDAIDFSLTVSGNGKSVVVSSFGNNFVARTIQIDGVVDPEQTTAVMFDPTTGTMSFVPAVFTTVDGKTTVTMLRTGNSIYSVVKFSKTFDDILGHWAKADIELLASKLIIKGKTASRFAPEDLITRAEFTSLLVRALGLDETVTTQFADVAPNAWFAGAVGAATKAGLIEGYTDHTFAPHQYINREQMAVMLARAAAIVSLEVPVAQPGIEKFNDQNEISTWALAHINEVTKVGIVTGVTESTFMPKAYATRAQAVVMIKRLLQAAKFI